MDETAYRQIYSEVIERPCAFEKAVLAKCVACRRAKRIQIAEREAVACLEPASRSRCILLHDQLRHSFSFALGTLRDDTPLPHAQEMRIQCGGLMGLQHVLSGNIEVDDVDGLLDAATRQWPELDDAPYSEIVHAAAQYYKGRHR